MIIIGIIVLFVDTTKEIRNVQKLKNSISTILTEKVQVHDTAPAVE